MVKISAFQGIIPARKFISQVPTQPYSNNSSAERESEMKSNPYSFLNIISNNHKINKKDRLKQIRIKIDNFKSKQILIKNEQESLYIYRQTNKHHTYTGLICSISLYKKNSRIIFKKKHATSIQKIQ